MSKGNVKTEDRRLTTLAKRRHLLMTAKDRIYSNRFNLRNRETEEKSFEILIERMPEGVNNNVWT